MSAAASRPGFFDLGGDSVLAIQVISRVRAAFAVELSPRDLFDTPTIATLSQTIQERVLALLEQGTTEMVGADGSN